jgi:O-antigen ligase
MGFNFHNLFIETTVNNGYVGLGIATLLIVVVGFSCLVGFLRAPTAETIFYPAYLASLYAGLTTESGLIGPFDTFTLFWIAAYIYGRDARRRKPRKRRSRLSNLPSGVSGPQGYGPPLLTDLRPEGHPS